jgi:hypothetical protein
MKQALHSSANNLEKRSGTREGEWGQASCGGQELSPVNASQAPAMAGQLAEDDLDHREETCRAALASAGVIAMRGYASLSGRFSQMKGLQDYLTETDGAVEAHIRELLAIKFQVTHSSARRPEGRPMQIRFGWSIRSTGLPTSSVRFRISASRLRS